MSEFEPLEDFGIKKTESTLNAHFFFFLLFTRNS